MGSSDQWRALERAIKGGGDGICCFLVYEGTDDRRGGAARLAEDLGASETVELAGHTGGMTELRQRLADAPGDGPVQVTGIEHWPGGVKDLGEQLGVGLAKLRNECPRPVLVWARDAELNELLKAGGDLHARVNGNFDLRPETRVVGAP